MKLSIVIPCYNEEKSLPYIADRFAAILDRPDVEVIMVNNGSTDGSAALMADLASRYPWLRVVTVETNQGYGFGILAGLKAGTGEYLGWTHGDLQTPPDDCLRALRVIEQHASPANIYVKGRRYGRPLPDVFFTLGMGIFESLYLRSRLFDINAQPNFFHRSFFAGWQNPPADFSLDLYALYQARKQKLQLVRFPVHFGERLHGKSHWNTDWRAKWKFIKRTFAYSVKLRSTL